MENKRLQIDAELHKKLKMIAVNSGETILEITNRVVREFIENTKKSEEVK